MAHFLSSLLLVLPQGQRRDADGEEQATPARTKEEEVGPKRGPSPGPRGQPLIHADTCLTLVIG